MDHQAAITHGHHPVSWVEFHNKLQTGVLPEALGTAQYEKGRPVVGQLPKGLGAVRSTPPEHQYTCLVGGSIRASLSTFQQLWIIKPEYHGMASSLVSRGPRSDLSVSSIHLLILPEQHSRQHT
ncbi:hypothetical protein FQN60_008522, partial [Etheostoma spectabile]